MPISAVENLCHALNRQRDVSCRRTNSRAHRVPKIFAMQVLSPTLTKTRNQHVRSCRIALAVRTEVYMGRPCKGSRACSQKRQMMNGFTMRGVNGAQSSSNLRKGENEGSMMERRAFDIEQPKSTIGQWSSSSRAWFCNLGF